MFLTPASFVRPNFGVTFFQKLIFFENLTVYSGFNGFQWLYNEKTKNLGIHFLQSFLCSRLTGLCFSCLFFSETIKKYIFNMILMVKIPYGSKK